MARFERKLEVVMVGDSRNLERAFKRSGKASESFGRKLGRGAGKGMLLLGGGVATAAVAGVAALGVGLVKSGKAAAEAEASNARLAAQLRTMGKDNEAVKAQIDKTVQSLSMMSGFDDEDLQDAFTNLVRASGNVAKSQRDIGLAADMAASGTMNLTTATKLINRVNNGSVTALKRYGIAVDENTTKEEAMALLRQKFAGQAEAFGKTAAGAQARLGVALENTFEQVGVALTPLIVEFSNVATKYLPGIAQSASKYLGEAIAWIKANWPQIRSTIVTVFDAIQVAWETVIKPTAQGIITALGAVVGFVRDNWPQIKAIAQSVFGWIQTNIVPTVQMIATIVGTLVRGMTWVWREHGETIKKILKPVFDTLVTIFKGGLTILRELVEMSLAAMRFDFAEVFESIKTIVKTVLGMAASIATVSLRVLWEIFAAAGTKIVTVMADALGGLKDKVVKKFDEIKTGISDAKTAAVSNAFNLGRDVLRGVINGIGSLAGWLQDKFWSTIGGAVDWAKKMLGIASPSKVTMDQIGLPMIDGIAYGLAKGKRGLVQALGDIVTNAVSSARSNLSSLTSGLASMLGRIGSAQAGGMRSSGVFSNGMTLAEIRAQQARVGREREKARLEQAVRDAQTDEDRKQAQQDLDDWMLDEEARVLEEKMAEREKAYDEDIAHLTESFNRGIISAETFQARLRELIGGNTGAELGSEFATMFGQQLEAVIAQIGSLAGFAGIATGGPASESVSGGIAAGVGSANEERFKDALAKWQAKNDDLKEAAKDAKKAWDDAVDDAKKKDSPGGTTITTAEQKRITNRKAAYDDAVGAKKAHDSKKPQRSAFGLAMGGILKRQVFTAGEAGPEAVIPLSSGRAQRMLASAIDGVGGAGRGGVTVVNVTVNGNEFSAAEFARKIAPELRRQVSMTRSA